MFTSMVRLIGVAMIAGSISTAAIIDSFNGSPDSAQSVSDILANGIVVSSTVGNRTIFVDKTAGVDGLQLDAIAITTVDGFFAGSAGPAVAGRTGASYSGLWDLTAPTQGLSIELLRNDLAGSTLSFFVSDGTNTATSGQFALPVIMSGPGQNIIAMLSGFSGIGAVNRSAVTSLGFTNTHVTAGDLILDNFETYVPEPGTYLLMGAGLLGLFSIRRKRA